MAREKEPVSASFLTAYPDFPTYAGVFRDLIKVLMSHGGVYVPEFLKLSDSKGRFPFSDSSLDELSDKWDRSGPVFEWILNRRRPFQVQLYLGKGRLPFESFSIHIERDYLRSREHLSEFLMVLRDFYGVLRPAYGEGSILEMETIQDSPLGKQILGWDIKRALPNVYWANFLGPEYVEMFGKDRVFSSPGYSVEPLPDGGALLLLSQSPLDYLEDRTHLDELRLEIKQHLGVEAFDTGDFHYKGRVPKFRYLEERMAAIKIVSRETSRIRRSDDLFRLGRREWERWVENNSSIAKSFIQDMNTQGIQLDFTPSSLKPLDDYVHKLNDTGTIATVNFLKKIAAYVSQIVISQTGATWTFTESDDIPNLKVGNINFSPLSRTQKVLFEGEKFEPWYSFLKNELMRKSQ